MNDIHPSAVIDECVELGDNNYIGPHCYFTGYLTVGDNNRFESHCAVGTRPEHTQHWHKDGRIIIGDNGTFREHISIHAAMIDGLTRIDNDVIMIGESIVLALFTPGHYYDSICYWAKDANIIFTGDTMFVGRTGRTVDTKSNINHLYTSIYQQILKLPEQTTIYPGHHYGYTPHVTLKENIALSPFFQCSSEDEFIKVMEAYEKGRSTRL